MDVGVPFCWVASPKPTVGGGEGMFMKELFEEGREGGGEGGW